MAQDAIQAVRQAETNAAALVKEATAKREAMLLQAQTDAAALKDRLDKDAMAEEKAALEKAALQNEALLKTAAKQAEEEIAALKQLAAKKQADALKLVTAELVH